MCSLSKKQSILLRETIQNAFFFSQNYAPFFDFDFLCSIKHPTAKRWDTHVVLLFVGSGSLIKEELLLPQTLKKKAFENIGEKGGNAGT